MDPVLQAVEKLFSSKLKLSCIKIAHLYILIETVNCTIMYTVSELQIKKLLIPSQYTETPFSIRKF